VDRFAEQLWTALATTLVMVLLGVGLQALARRGKYPRLPEPDPEQADTAADRRRYYLANGLALGLGVVFGVALWMTPPLAEDGVLWRQSLYDHPAGRALGPLFFALSVGGLAVPKLADRLVAPGPLLHILARSAARQHAAGIDLRKALRWLSLVIGSLALLLHFGLRNEHATFDGNGLRWRSWPWQQEAERTWNEVADIRLVASLEAMTGRIVQRPHLSIEFADGEVLRLGKFNDRHERIWAEAAAIASARSGVAVRRVERE
jgi:hypothetical protein